MSLPTPETQAKVASEAAEVFLDHFYDALSRRHKLGPLYASTSPKLTVAGVAPDISINGHVVASVADFDALLDKQGGPTSYEVVSFDAHPVNPHYVLGAPDQNHNRDGDKLSFAVQVTGSVRYGKGEDSEISAFNETFLLVPHWEARARGAAKGMRRWVIASQNFRRL